jgi:hypothetical protein
MGRSLFRRALLLLFAIVVTIAIFFAAGYVAGKLLL